jgi:hypothetical protein
MLASIYHDNGGTYPSHLQRWKCTGALGMMSGSSLIIPVCPGILQSMARPEDKKCIPEGGLAGDVMVTGVYIEN